MLTKEDLIKVGITDEQAVSIAALSKRDEDTVVSALKGKTYGDLEKDILEVSGIEKKGGERAFDYMKRVIGDFKGKTPEIKGKLDALTLKYDDLVKKGGDATKQLQDDLNDSKALVKTLRKDITTKETIHLEAIAKITTDNERELIRADLMAATSGFKLKADLDVDFKNYAINKAIDSVIESNKIARKDGKNEYRDEQGQILRDSERYAVKGKDLLKPFLKTILAEDQGGTGGKGGDKGGKGGVFKITATNQSDAIREVGNHLAAKGLLRGSDDFAAEQAALMETVKELPVE